MLGSWSKTVDNLTIGYTHPLHLLNYLLFQQRPSLGYKAIFETGIASNFQEKGGAMSFFDSAHLRLYQVVLCAHTLVTD